MNFSISLKVFEMSKQNWGLQGTTVFILFSQMELFYIPRIFNKIKVKEPTAMHNNVHH